jgi:hypothetical protein
MKDGHLYANLNMLQFLLNNFQSMKTQLNALFYSVLKIVYISWFVNPLSNKLSWSD